jgi:hypothetical protein
MRDHLGQNPAQDAVAQGAFVGLFHIGTRLINQVHVIHARRAGCHAGKAGQATIQMFDGARISGPPGFQHFLDQVDPPTRAVQLVPQDLICRASRGAKAAMHARPQDRICLGQRGIAQLFSGEIGLHQAAPPALKIPRGSNFARNPAVRAATPGASG